MAKSRFIRPFQQFTQIESLSGIFLLLCSALALFLANLPFQNTYHAFWSNLFLGMSIQDWVNDGLMAIFFLVIGLEIKRELLQGELSTYKKAALPVIAAIGGMIVPALIYSLINYKQEGSAGWGIPMATDIAFAIGILSLLGKRVSQSLKIFLTALAVVDDIGAVFVIVLFYTNAIHWFSLVLAMLAFIVLFFANINKIFYSAVYLIFGILIWMALLNSGVHASIAGILVACTVPLKIGTRWELKLHPWVSYGIMPIFALANAGVSFQSEKLFHPISYGIIAALVLGKQFGITFFSWLAVKIGLAKLPERIRFWQIYGVSWLGGIGFTMSLFVTHLAFKEGKLINLAKIGIFIASFLSAVGGVSILILGYINIKTNEGQ